jgi:putative Holliday junction resolvase
LGVDVGSVRIGVAVSDPDGILATPVETVRRDRTDRHLKRLTSWFTNWRRWKSVGLRAHLPTGRVPPQRTLIGLAEDLARRVAPTPVRLADERLTTVTAQRSLREAGVRARGQKAMIDQAAAVGILQSWLDQRRAVVGPHGEGDNA